MTPKFKKAYARLKAEGWLKNETRHLTQSEREISAVLTLALERDYETLRDYAAHLDNQKQIAEALALAERRAAKHGGRPSKPKQDDDSGRRRRYAWEQPELSRR